MADLETCAQMKLEAVPWRKLGGVPPDDLAAARIEFHGSVQPLASFGQAPVEPRPDYSQRSMTWNAEESAFFSEATGDASSLRVALSPRDMTLSIRAAGVIAAECSLVGRTLEQTYGWLEDELVEIRGEPRVELGRPKDVIPPGPVADGAPFTGGMDGDLLELEAWFANAAAILGAVQSTLAEATPVRCWPHHFDIATLLILDPEVGAEEGRSVGVGLSPGDEGYSSPYFYVTPFPYPDPADLPDLPGGAHWHREGWVGAVMTADALISAGGAAAQEASCRSFIEAAVGASKVLLAIE
jgi:hypothetical protein